MLKRLLHIFLIIASPLSAQTETLPREYRGPLDSEGFLLPWRAPATPETIGDSRAPLQVIALNKKGFVHRSRRAAEALNPEPLALQEPARIYSPSQSFIALLDEGQALLILHPQTSVAVEPLVDRWQYAFTGDRGVARISTHARNLTLLLKPGDPQSPWLGHRLLLDPGSDLYVKYETSTIVLYLLRGHLTYRIDPFVPLLSDREPGLLFDWEQKQIERKPKTPYAIEIFAGQELTMKPGLNYQIGLPDAETWQAPVLRTSPQLGESTDTNKLRQALKDLRLRWLDVWRDGADLPRLLLESRFEEAYDKAGDNEGVKMLCLYRLQQETAAEKKRAALPDTSPYAAALKEESIRAQLRRNAHEEVKPPKDLVHTSVLPEEIYLLASSEQQLGRWRSALDLWEHWPSVGIPVELQQSYKEWQRHLDEKKPFSWMGSAELGWTDNALHLPTGTAAPAEISHRSSWTFRTRHQVDYLIERSDAFSVYLEPALDLKIFQHSGLADLQRVEGGLDLPLMLHLPWDQHSLQFKPFFHRLMTGSSMGLDRFGYEMIWHTPFGSWRPDLTFAQDQNLDFGPTLDHRLDALSGEPAGAIDRSVRRNTLGVRSGLYSVIVQTWDYRYVASQKDDRQRLQFNAEYSKAFPYDLSLTGNGALTLDTFAKERSSVTAIDLKLQLSWLGWYRRHPYVGLERDMRQSGDKEQGFTEMQWIIGIRDRW